MNPRQKNSSDKYDNVNQSTSRINNFLQEHKESNPQEDKIGKDEAAIIDNLPEQEKPYRLTKSYRPKNPPTYTKEENQEFAESFARNIRTDGQNLRFDGDSQMWFYPEISKNPSDTESVEEHDGYCSRSRGCTLI